MNKLFQYFFNVSEFTAALPTSFFCGISFSLALILPISIAHAETTKQISYPVSIQAGQASEPVQEISPAQKTSNQTNQNNQIASSSASVVGNSSPLTTRPIAQPTRIPETGIPIASGISGKIIRTNAASSAQSVAVSSEASVASTPEPNAVTKSENKVEKTLPADKATPEKSPSAKIVATKDTATKTNSAKTKSGKSSSAKSSVAKVLVAKKPPAKVEQQSTSSRSSTTAPTKLAVAPEIKNEPLVVREQILPANTPPKLIPKLTEEFEASEEFTSSEISTAEKNEQFEVESLYRTRQSQVRASQAQVAPAPVVVPAALQDEGDEGEIVDGITNILRNDVAGTELQESIAEPAPPPPTSPAIDATPLPVSAQREKFVIEFQKYVETKLVPRVPGVALAIIADGKVKVLEGYGLKKVGGRDGINVDTTFRLASVSKTIAGTVAGVMVDDGLITWDTRVTSVLPNVAFSNPKYGNQLTLQHIMSQSTGLPTHSGDNFIEEGYSFADVVNRFKYVNFVCPPGKCYGYQNVSLSLVSSIVQKKTGKTYEQFVREKLFAPLGMRTASFGMDGLKANNNYALPHVLAGRGWRTETITENYYRINPAAGANASITDMSRWVLAQMGHHPNVLPPHTLKAVHGKVTKNTPAQSHYGAADGVTNTHYGMGWRVFDYRGDKNFIHHGGYVLGFRSEMVINPELQIGMVILSNSNKLPGSIIFKFLDAYEDEKRGPRKIALPIKKKK